ncbi:MAG: biotin/lipoyl-containing protein, partial [Pseudomonadota bacterium]
ALAAAKREAQAGFGDDNMLVEKYLQQPRHVEVQVFCDQAGNGVYLFERDCSVQRRHQKIIEEAPAPGLNEGTREAMGEAALKAAAAVNYVGAGTVEFLLDASGEFFFMEMNTRLQVEHPVTEAITGQDLVEWQLRVAFGEDLPLRQSELGINGHAFEARIYAEDPANDFLPASGTLHWLRQPEVTDVVRVDTGVVQGDDVGVFYDPMIAKLIVWGSDRQRALKRLSQALAAYQIAGVSNNIKFLQSLAKHEAFASADLSTDFIERYNSELFAESGPTLETRLQLASVYWVLRQRAMSDSSDAISPWDSTDHWRMNGPSISKQTLVTDGAEYSTFVEILAPGDFLVRVDDTVCRVSAVLEGAQLTMTLDDVRHSACVVECESAMTVFATDGVFEFAAQRPDIGEAELHDDGSRFKAPMNGTVVDLLVTAGDSVKAGDTLVIMEAMKMEHAIKAPSDGRVNDVFFAKGDLVDGGADLLSFEASESA